MVNESEFEVRVFKDGTCHYIEEKGSGSLFKKKKKKDGIT